MSGRQATRGDLDPTERNRGGFWSGRPVLETSIAVMGVMIGWSLHGLIAWPAHLTMLDATIVGASVLGAVAIACGMVLLVLRWHVAARTEQDIDLARRRLDAMDRHLTVIRQFRKT